MGISFYVPRDADGFGAQEGEEEVDAPKVGWRACRGKTVQGFAGCTCQGGRVGSTDVAGRCRRHLLRE